MPGPGPAADDRPPTWSDSVRLAVGTLTAVPVRPPRAVTPQTAGAAMLLGPLVGLVLGAAAALPAAAAMVLGLGAFPAATLAVATMALATRGLHLDGLADTADGLAASYDRERALSVMRLGNVGPAGAATLALVLLLQVAALAQATVPPVLSWYAAAPLADGPPSPPRLGWFAYSSLADGPPSAGDLLGFDLSYGTIGPVALVVGLALAAAAGRCALPLSCRRGVPSARPSGLGAAVAGTVPVLGAATALVLTAAVAAAAAGGLGRPWWQGVLAVAAAALAAVGVGLRATRRLGGITGDVLGAAVELATAAALLVLAAG